MCENVGIGRSGCGACHAREEDDHLEMLVIMSISIYGENELSEPVQL